MVLTGAGVSAESGIPTFRDPQVGLWENFNPAELATPYAFERDPALVWGWYEWRRMQIARAEPNPGNRAIANLARLSRNMTLVTQNVDDLHERAGSKDVIHLHGQIARPYCELCKEPHALATDIEQIPERGAPIEPPRCRACGGRVRPGVVWFGEDLPKSAWNAAQQAAACADVFFSVGTSSIVQPAASLLSIAAEAGAETIQINTESAPLMDSITHTLQGESGKVLPELLFQTWGPDANERGIDDDSVDVVIVRVGAEGGDLTLYGRKSVDRTWSYRLEIEDQTHTFITDQGSGEATTSRGSPWVRSWPEALELLDRYPWVSLRPILIHAEFKLPVWVEIERRISGKHNEITERAVHRWHAFCSAG